MTARARLARSALLALAALVIPLPVAAPPVARAAPPMVVAVLYFDNNSNDRQYDVLQKGLADMLITDLASVESLQIVEREKMQKLVDELKLQRSRYFDAKTAQKLGQGVGARYAVTGAISAFDPELRLDVRLIEVATAKVVMADKVVGRKDRFFDLEQQLVAKFIAGLDLRAARAESRAGSVDVKTLLKYSQGLDQADRGDLQGASKKLAEVVNDSPDFSLGRDKYASILRALREAQKRRAGALESAEDVLWRNIEQALAGGPPAATDRDKVQRYLGYRVARGNFILWKIKKKGELVAGSSSDLFFVPRRRLGEVGAWMKEWATNTEALARELAALRDPRRPSSTLDPEIDREDTKRGEEIGWSGIGEWSFLKSNRAWQALGDYVVRGRAPFWVSDHYRIRPSLAQIDPAWGKRGLEAFAKTRADIDKQQLSDDDKADEVAALIELEGEALVALGRKEEAITRWQSFLDANPKHKKFKDFEKQIEDMLAMGPEVEKFQKHLRACAAEGIGLSYEATNRVARADGPKGMRRLLADVERACAGNPMGMAWQAATYQFVARNAAELGDCALFDEVLGRARKAGPHVAQPVEQIPNGCQ